MSDGHHDVERTPRTEWLSPMITAARRSPWLTTFVIGGLVCLAYAVMPMTDDDRSVVTIVLAVALFGAVVFNATRHSLWRNPVWAWILVGLIFQLVVEIAWSVINDSDRNIDTAIELDLVAMVGYVTTIVGLLLLVHRRRRDRDLPALLDAAVMTVSIASVVHMLTEMAPWDQFDDAVSRYIATGFVLLDVFMVALVCTILRGPDRRSPALLLLVGGVAIQLLADVAANGLLLTSVWTWYSPAPMGAMWLFSYVLVAAATLHPAAKTVTLPTRVEPVSLTVHGVVVLAVAGLLLPVSALVSHILTGSNRTVALVVYGSVILMLILARLTLIAYGLQTRALVSETQARHDPLTGLPNRRTLEFTLERMMEISAEKDLPLSLAIIDLDHFKHFNDTHGHGAGDELLTESGEVWTAVLQVRRLISTSRRRTSDTYGVLARYGGEEFVLALLNVEISDAEILLEQMQAATPRGQSFSAGVAKWRDGEDSASLISRADSALYEAKRRGRNRIHRNRPPVSDRDSDADNVV